MALCIIYYQTSNTCIDGIHKELFIFEAGAERWAVSIENLTVMRRNFAHVSRTDNNTIHKD